MTLKRQWTIGTALLCAVVLIAGFLLLVRPQHAKASSVKTETSGVNAQIQSLQAQLAQLQEEKRNLPAVSAQLSRYQQQLPTDPMLPSVLRAIDAVAASNKVDLVNIAPGNPAQYTPAATTTSSGSTSAAAPVAGLADIPVVLSVSGSYWQIEGFLDSLEGLQRSMIVSSFSLTPGSSDSTATDSSVPTVGSGELTASISSLIFMSTSAAASGSTPSTSPSPSATTS